MIRKLFGLHSTAVRRPTPWNFLPMASFAILVSPSFLASCFSRLLFYPCRPNSSSSTLSFSGYPLPAFCYPSPSIQPAFPRLSVVKIEANTKPKRQRHGRKPHRRTRLLRPVTLHLQDGLGSFLPGDRVPLRNATAPSRHSTASPRRQLRGSMSCYLW